jgi:hypothetical protein
VVTIIISAGSGGYPGARQDRQPLWWDHPRP